MSLEQSKRIVEAAGGDFHLVGPKECSCGATFPSGGRYLDHCGAFAGPNLSLPENRHILIGYVEKICNTGNKWARFFAHLYHIISLSERTVDQWESRFNVQGVTVWQVRCLWNAPNDAILTALCRVIEEGE